MKVADTDSEILGGTGNFDLDALLSESMKAKKDALAVKEARKLLSDKSIPSETKREIEATVRAWELQREWTPVAATVMIDEQCCSHCNSTHEHYAGLFQKQRHRTSKIERWIKSDPVANKGLPQEVKFTEEYVPMCSDCMSEFGWQG